MRDVETRHRGYQLEVQKEYEGQFLELRKQMDQLKGANRAEVERLVQEIALLKPSMTPTGL